MWRAAFGPAANQLPQLAQLNPKQLYATLQKDAALPPITIDVADTYLKELMMERESETGRMQMMDAEQRRMVQQKQRQGLRQLNLTWMAEMVKSKAQLREKMALFWHGHFACRNTNIFFQQQLLHVLRAGALGSFRTLLHEVSKSAAMLQFLNAAQNRKGKPNENFAREVMELFTMGRGHYAEKDIKEAARAFTGWRANARGEFQFRKGVHDGGTKTIFGKSAAFTGEEVLDLLLDQKTTARYITQKVYKAFVAETVDGEKAAWLADRFYNSDYNISALLTDIFTSDWFYDEANIGTKIKSPVELLVGLQRTLPMKLENEDSLLVMQRLLGQILFYPPNVAGWPGGRSWIDSTTLVTRMRLPQLLADADSLQLQPKTDDDQMMGKKDLDAGQKTGPGTRQLIHANIDWNLYVKGFENFSRPQLLSAIGNTVLQKATLQNNVAVSTYVDNSSRENYIKSATLQFMSLPEYQVC